MLCILHETSHYFSNVSEKKIDNVGQNTEGSFICKIGDKHKVKTRSPKTILIKTTKLLKQVHMYLNQKLIDIRKSCRWKVVGSANLTEY